MYIFLSFFCMVADLQNCPNSDTITYSAYVFDRNGNNLDTLKPHLNGKYLFNVNLSCIFDITTSCCQCNGYLTNYFYCNKHNKMFSTFEFKYFNSFKLCPIITVNQPLLRYSPRCPL